MKNLNTVLLLFPMLAGALLTVWGLTHLQWPQDFLWADKNALIRYVSFLIVCTVLVYVGAWWSRKSALLVGGIVAVGIALLAGALWSLLVTLWFAVASALLGKFILSLPQIKPEEENWLTNFLVGAGVYGTAVGLLAHFPINYSGVYGFALALPIMLGWRIFLEKCRSFLTHNNNNTYNLAEFSVNRIDVLIAIVALIYFVVALMPEIGYDSLGMHLFIPVHLAQRHQWGFDASTYVWAVMPALGDFVFSIGYMLAGETAARLINVGFIFILAWLVRDLVFWAGGSAFGARWAVLIFFSTPLTFMEGNSLFIESVWTSFSVAGTLAILKACSTTGKSKFELPIAGFLLGCALASKAVTSSILIALFLILVWRYKSWLKKNNTLSLATGLCLFLVIGIIPYATAWHLTGNPVFPFFNKVFQSPYYVTDSNFTNPYYSGGIPWDFIYRATFESSKYLEAASGAPGFQWLLLFPASCISLIVTRNNRQAALLIVGVVSILITCQSQAYLRYLFPSWVILVAFIGIALGAEINKKKIVRYFWWTTLVLTVSLNTIFFTAGPYYKDFAVYSLTDASSRDAYLLNSQPIRRAVQLVNTLNDSRTPVAVFSDPLVAGLTGNYFYPGWYNFAFQAEIRAIQSEQDLTNMFIKRGVSFVILDSKWNGINCCPDVGKAKQALVEKVTENIADYGLISVRKLKTDFHFTTELLSNPDFISINGWSLSSDAKYDPETHSILANVTSPATQAVVVSTGRRYLNTVVARCAKEPTAGRVQINWLDVKGQFINTDIKTFECSAAWTEHTMKVTAPINAVSAVIYTVSHTSTMMEFKSNSFRQ